nr:helix-turn-helix transcriptional regulator [uncultured Roseateles sp.]
MPEAASLVRPLRVPPGNHHGMPDIGDEHDLARSGLGTGFMRTWRSDNVMVTVTDAEFQLPRHLRLEVVSDALLIRASSSGDCRYTTDGGVTWQCRAPAVTVTQIPQGTKLEVDIAAGVRQQSMTVLIQPRVLVALACDDVPESLSRIGESPVLAAEQLLSMPLSPEIQSLLYDLRHSRLPGKLRNIQMGSRAIELTVLMMAGWSARLGGNHTPGLLKRDADLLAAARHALLERCTNPPTLIALARELGTNKNKLNRLFRDRFGTTPQSYALERRMERARSLIADGRMTVGQVAEAVGYQHQSSFTTAFRHAMGVSPREYASREGARAEH